MSKVADEAQAIRDEAVREAYRLVDTVKELAVREAIQKCADECLPNQDTPYFDRTESNVSWRNGMLYCRDRILELLENQDETKRD